jgi:hypothetical protein
MLDNSLQERGGKVQLGCSASDVNRIFNRPGEQFSSEAAMRDWLVERGVDLNLAIRSQRRRGLPITFPLRLPMPTVCQGTHSRRERDSMRT